MLDLLKNFSSILQEAGIETLAAAGSLLALMIQLIMWIYKKIINRMDDDDDWPGSPGGPYSLYNFKRREGE